MGSIFIFYIIFLIFAIILLLKIIAINYFNIFRIIIRYFIFIFDYIYFCYNIFKSIFINFYYYAIDIINGQYLSNEYTDTDLDYESIFIEEPEFSEEYFEELSEFEDELEIFKKEFDLINFEYIYINIRVLSYVRFLFLQTIKFINKFYCFALLNLIRPFSLFFLIFREYYIKRYFNIFLKLGMFEFLVEKYWVFYLSIRTNFFIFVYHQYFFTWIYKLFNWDFWITHELRGMAPYSEKEPSSKYYNFFVWFYRSPLLPKIRKLSYNFIFSIIIYSIYFFLHKIFSVIILLLKFIGRPFIYFVKIEYRINFYFYRWFLKLEFINWKEFIRLFISVCNKIFKISLSKIVFFVNLKFWLNLCIKNKLILILNNSFIRIIIIFNTIVLNIIIILIKLLPQIVFKINYLKGIFIIILVFYYIDLETLLLTWNYAIDFMFKFYEYVDPFFYIGFNLVDEFPISSMFGGLPYVHSVGKLEYNELYGQQWPDLDPLPFGLVLDSYDLWWINEDQFAIGTEIARSLVLVEDRLIYYIFIYNDCILYINWFKKNWFHYKTIWYHTIYFLKSYYYVWYYYLRIGIPYRYIYLKKRIFYCWWYLLTGISLKLIFVPYIWYYFLLKNFLFLWMFKIIDFIITYLMITLYLISKGLSMLLSYIKPTIVKIIYFLYEFSIFYFYKIFFYILNIVYEIQVLSKYFINWLKGKSVFLSLLFESVYCQSLTWYFYIITVDFFNYKLYLDIYHFFKNIFINNDYHDLLYIVVFEASNYFISLYIKYNFFKKSTYQVNYFDIELNEIFKFIFYLYLFLCEWIDQSIDSISLNYDQFRIYYFNRLDVDARILLGEVSKKVRKHITATRKRWITNKRKKLWVCGFNGFDSYFMASFFFIINDFFFKSNYKLDYLHNRNSIYGEYYWQNSYIIVIEYILLIAVICSFNGYFFPKMHVFLNTKNPHLNPEYCWRRFRKSGNKEVAWIFANINEFVTGYFENKNLGIAKDFMKKFENDEDFVKHIETLKYASETGILNIKTYFEEIGENPYRHVWRGYWIEGFAQKLKQHNKETILDPKFNFSLFYFDPNYDNYYELYLNKYLFLYGFMLYGIKRNKYLENAFLNEGEFRIVPQIYNRILIKKSETAQKIKDYFFKLDEMLFYNALPSWCLHKDLFSFQIVNTKEIYGIEDNKTVDEEKIFLIESFSFVSSFFVFWLFWFPGYLCLKLMFSHPRFCLILRHEIEFYLYSFWGRIWLINNLFDIFSGVYWSDIGGDRKKAGTQVKRRRKIKRRFRSRLRYIFDVTSWGPFCLWRCRNNRSMYFGKFFYSIYLYLKYIILYVLISFYISFRLLKTYFKMMYKTENLEIFTFNQVKNFWKFRFYLEIVNKMKLNYYKTW